jgi:outer membrane receptor protein involved in Fe transport
MTEPNMRKASVYARSELSYTQGGTPSYEAGVAGGAPLIEGVLGLRASFWYRHDGGWIDRIDPFSLQTVQKDANYDNTVALRVAAKWAVNENVTITPSVMYQDRKRNDISVFWPSVTGANGQVRTSNPSNDQYISANPTARPEPDHYFLPALKVEADLGSASLISNTSYYNRQDLSGYDGTMYNLSYYQTVAGRPGNLTGTPVAGFNQIGSLTYLSDNLYPLIDQYGLHLPASVQNYRALTTVTNEQRVFTQEVRLQSNDAADSALTWTTGLFFQQTRQVSLEAIYDPMVDALFTALFGNTATGTNGFNYPLVQGGYSYYNLNHGTDVQVAGFGEASYKLTDKLKVTAGARLAHTRFDYTHYADGTQNGQLNLNSGGQAENPFTPKLGVAYQANQNDLYYATYAKGFRDGGDNAPIAANLCQNTFTQLGLGNASPPAYHSDRVNSFEVGSKNKVNEGLRVASSVYYIRWSDIQQNIYLPGCGFQFTTNVGQAVAKGFDVQLEWSPTPALDFESAIGYTSARFVSDASLTPTGLPVTRTGDAIVGESGTSAPPWTITVGAQYNFRALDHKAFVRLDYEYESKNPWHTAAQDPGVSPTVYDPYAYTPPATTLISARAGVVLDRWSVSGFIENLLDAHPMLPPSSYAHSDADANANPGQGVLVRNYTFRPRTFGVTTTYKF